MSNPSARIFTALIFLAAFLLFSVQPLIGKFVLPWFGGTASVWTTALLFFQVLLLAGYAFAHAVSRLRPRLQALIYVSVLVVAVSLLPITPKAAWMPKAGSDPSWSLLKLLLISVGLPYFVLAAASPLLQSWFSRGLSTGQAYRLYAWSNGGSLLGLLAYPILIEPLMDVVGQAWAWSALFVVFALAAAWMAFRWQRTARPPAAAGAEMDGSPARDLTAMTAGEGMTKTDWAEPHEAPLQAERSGTAGHAEPATPPTAGQQALWLLLSSAAVITLMAVTNFMTQDVASVPLMWILPLAVYLIAFIVAFSGPQAYSRRQLAVPFLALCLAGAMLAATDANPPLSVMLLAPLLMLAAYCLVCLGELYALKPHPRYLTRYYLLVSAGGALGGLFVGLVAPRLFPDYFELHVGLALGLGTVAVIWAKRTSEMPWSRWPRRGWAVAAGVVALVAVILLVDVGRSLSRPVALRRNFFGVLRVVDQADRRVLSHGRIIHGFQLTDGTKRCQPTSYYGRNSGLGRAAAVLRSTTGSIRLGVVGLGVGTDAVYADHVRFYEINPEVKTVAETLFTFLSDCVPSYEVVIGDARLSLEAEPPQSYDLLVLDAFSGDSIPVHLLTAEAMSVYRRHLRPGGVIAFHISNSYLDLRPVVGGLAQKYGLTAATVFDPADAEKATFASLWVLLSDDRGFFDKLMADGAIQPTDMEFSRRVLWTDRYSNLLGVIKF